MAIVVPTRLQVSQLHGIGLFAAAPVRRGDLVWTPMPEFTHRLDERAFLALPTAQQLYVVWYGCWIGGGRQWEIPVDDARFTNHAENPSAVYVPDSDVLVAARDLAAGDEITNDYRAICDFFAAVPSFDRGRIAAALTRWRELFP